MLALELIDSGVGLARRSGDASEFLTEEPGVALLEDQRTLTGAAAARSLRLQPLLAQMNFWRGLSIEPLTRTSRLAQTSADLAYAHTDAILSQYKGQAERVLLAVPAGYSREQLGLLLGVVNETGIPVAGLVDAALAACSLEPA